ncbi:MAG TPA: cupin domain-containing protein [Chthoniobacterales bacterium]|nr:cupin domain-containing protein [Chthoniobacterales bacterium]
MMTKKPILFAFVLTLSGVLVLAQTKQTKPTAAAQNTIFSSAELQWQKGPASLPEGAQFVVLDGDPTKEGSFTIRLKMPAGYKIPPHTHPTAERVTVISGVAHLGYGDKFDESAGRELKTGDFTVIPAGVAHFAWSRGEAILQIHSEGPFQRKFINPADEPASAKK